MIATNPQPDPVSVATLHQTFEAACSAQHEVHLTEARQQYLLLLKHLPRSPLIHYNLGLVLFHLGEHGQALEEFSLADANGPEDCDTLFNLALCQKKTGDQPAAIATYRRILDIHPDHVDCLYNLGGCHRDLNEDQQAIRCYQQVLALNPSYLPAVNNLAYIHHRRNENDLAIFYYGQVLEQRPENASVQYLLAALLGVPLDHPPDAYIRDFFDSYAEDFEYNLVSELGYDNPRQLCGCLRRSDAGETSCGHGLDLGCGTGLSGVAFKGMVEVLDGVDLSANMLIRAAEKGCYARLHEDSILHHLTSTQESYDFFLATDVFIYVGDLVELFSAAKETARPGALFCFSTEHLDGDDYQLLQTGRYAYSPAYIHRTAAAAGWKVLNQESARLRRERDEWLQGDLWVLRLGQPPSCGLPV